jgi:hypothetical protein
LGAALLIAGYAINSVHPFVWWSPAIEGRVLDAKSGAPVVGAVVVADWRLTGPEGLETRELALRETTSSEDGRFAVEGWGPKFHFGRGDLSAGEPTVRIAHRDYVPLLLRNAYFIPRNYTGPYSHNRIIVRFDRSGRDFTLTPSVSLEKEADAWIELKYSLAFAYDPPQCDSTLVQRMVQEIAEVSARMERGGLTTLAQRLQGSGCKPAQR